MIVARCRMRLRQRPTDPSRSFRRVRLLKGLASAAATVGFALVATCFGVATRVRLYGRYATSRMIAQLLSIGVGVIASRCQQIRLNYSSN